MKRNNKKVHLVRLLQVQIKRQDKVHIEILIKQIKDKEKDDRQKDLKAVLQVDQKSNQPIVPGLGLEAGNAVPS